MVELGCTTLGLKLSSATHVRVSYLFSYREKCSGSFRCRYWWWLCSRSTRPRLVYKLRPGLIRPNMIGMTKKCRGTVPLPCKKNGSVNNNHPVKISEEQESDKMISYYQHHCHCSPDQYFEQRYFWGRYCRVYCCSLTRYSIAQPHTMTVVSNAASPRWYERGLPSEEKSR